jgi:hypothetical protein
LALESKRDESLASLKEALDHGLAADTRKDLDKEPDLAALHQDPRFAALVASAQQH